MRIEYKKSFVKSLRKLSRKHQSDVQRAVALFIEEPFHSSLKNHALQGTMKSLRSISAGYDLRIVFEEKDGYAVVVMIMVGTHNQVYY